MPTILRLALENAAAATALALLAAVAGHFLRERPAFRHFLWLLVLLKLVTPPLWDIPVSVAGRQSPAVVAERPNVVTEIEVLTEVEDLLNAEPIGPSDSPSEELSEAPGVPVTAPGRVAGFVRGHVVAVVATSWLAGSLLTLGWLASGVGRLRKALRLAKPVSEAMAERVDEIAVRLGLTRPPRVVMVPGAIMPGVCATGFSAVVLVPDDLWKRLDRSQADALLTHELAHLARRDHWVRNLELAVMVLYWWLPVVWWARRGLRDAEEDCCDAWVVWAMPGKSRSYAETLLEAVDFLSGGSTFAPMSASGFGHAQHLKRRLVMIMSGSAIRTLGPRGLLTTLGLAAALLPLRPSWGDEPKPKGEAKAEQKTIVIIKDGDDKNAPNIGGAVVLPSGAELMNTLSVTLDAPEIDFDIDLDLDNLTGPEAAQEIAKRIQGSSGQIQQLISMLTRTEIGQVETRAEIERLSKEIADAVESKVGLTVATIVGDKEFEAVETKLAEAESELDDIQADGNDGDPAKVREHKERVAELRKKRDELRQKGRKVRIEGKGKRQEGDESRALDAKLQAANTKLKSLSKTDAELRDKLEGLKVKTDGKGHAKKQAASTVTLFARNMDDDKAPTKELDPKAKAEAEKLEAEVKDLAAKVKAAGEEMKVAGKKFGEAQKQLHDATRKLSGMQSPRAARRVVVNRTENRAPKVVTTPLQIQTRRPDNDQDRRIADLEKKLDKILDELKSTKKSKDKD